MNKNYDTDLILTWYPELRPIAQRYSLQFKLDNFGFGRCIFHDDEEIGFFNDVYGGEIEIHYVEEDGMNYEIHTNYRSLVESIEQHVIKFIKNKTY